MSSVIRGPVLLGPDGRWVAEAKHCVHRFQSAVFYVGTGRWFHYAGMIGRSIVGCCWFGVRGIGSIYYLCYAINSGLDQHLASTLFGVVADVIVVSSIVHGFTLGPYLRRFAR